MTLKEILKSQGLSDEQIEKVIGEMKQNKIFTAGEENLDIRYQKLQQDYDNLNTKHGEATNLIEQLKAGTKDNDELQGKVKGFEDKITSLEKELETAKLDYAVQLMLRDAEATDTDYLAFKVKEKYGKDLALDENGKVKGFEDKIAGLKTQFPAQFPQEQKNKVEPQPLPSREDKKGEPVTLADAIKAQYENKN